MAKAYFEDTGKIHPSIATKPPLRRDCIRYLNAYRLLSGARLWDQVGPKPIPVSEVLAYLQATGVKGSEAINRFLRVIRRMDLVELRHLQREMKANANK